MDQKGIKLSYQKARLVLLFSTLVVYTSFSNFFHLLVGSDFDIVNKQEKSMWKFIVMVAVVVYRQKFEMQTTYKYNMETLNLGKVLFLPNLFIAMGLKSVVTGKGRNGEWFIQLLFLGSFIYFYYEKACRTLGINNLLASNSSSS